MGRRRTGTVGLYSLIIGALLFGGAAQSAVAAGETSFRVYVDSVPVALSAAPYMADDDLMVPLRPVMRALNLESNWDAARLTLTVNTPEGSIIYQAGNPLVIIYGAPIPHTTAPEFRDGALYVSVSALRYDFQLDVRWNRYTGAVMMTSPLPLYIQHLLANSSFFRYEGADNNGVPHGQGKWTLNGALIYEGSFADGAMHGAGTLYRNGLPAYEGTFSGNRAEGTGKLYLTPDRYYYGQIDNGVPDGKGALYEKDLLVYSGDWVSGYMDGTGKLYNAKGLLYDGEMTKNRRNGYGVEYVDGDKFYAGDWVMDAKTGQGKQFDGEDTVYIGGWKDGLYDGSGTAYTSGEILWYVTNEDGSIVSEEMRDVTYATPGMYANGMLMSEGPPLIYMEVDDDADLVIREDDDDEDDEERVVSSDILNGLVEMYVPGSNEATEAGVLVDMDRVYLGYVRDGKKHGYGVLYEPDEEDQDDEDEETSRIIYAGEFTNDVRSGDGIGYNNGLIWYEGEWSGDEPSGWGKMYEFDDTDFDGDDYGVVAFVEGRFQNGELVSDGRRYKYSGPFVNGTMDGYGVVMEILENNATETRYVGTFARGRYDGEGTLYSNDRILYEGEFENGNRSGEGITYYLNEPDDVEYEGEFEKGLYEGYGKLYYTGDKLRYEGEFSGGMMHGYGTLYYKTSFGAPKKWIEGMFVKGKPHGYGKYYNDKGRLIFEGEFVDGVMVDD